MNKNTKRRLAAYRKEKKAQGMFPASIFKKKSKPFPQPKDAGIPLIEQIKWWNNLGSGIVAE